jgi:iron complex outermembrane receptor protein
MKNNMLRRQLLLTAFASTVAVAIAAPVQAQEVSADPQANAGIGEIVVSARRRKETIQQTPVAMTAIAPSQLEAAAAVKISDLQGSAPNVLITQQGSGAATANISIRGLSFADVEKSFDPTVAMVVDGIFIGTSTGQLLDFFDIESIEILRGPQGTLFGRNTIGGVINIKRSRPTGEFGGKFELGYGKFGSFTGKAVVNMPIVQDKLAAKFFYFHGETDGYYRDVLSGRRSGGGKTDNFGASFLMTPTENFNALLTLERQSQGFEPVDAAITNSSELFCTFLPAGGCDRNTTDDVYTSFDPYPSPSDGKPHHGSYRSPAATLEMNWDAGGINITSVTGYRKSKERQTQSYSTAGLYDTDRRQQYHQFSQELRGSGKLTDTFDYVVGGYFFDSKYHITQETWVFGANTGAPQDTTGKAQTYAAFGDFNWSFADQWRLSFGGRYTHDKKEMQTLVGSTDLGPQSASWSKFTPKVSIDFRPTNDLMVYGNWSRGYRSGGFNGRGLTTLTAATPFAPETVDSFEVGLKSAWFDRRLLFNLAAFYTKYKDMQQSTTVPGGPTGNQTLVTNVGGAKVKGIEMDLTAKPASDLIIRASIGYLNSRFNDFVTSDVVGTDVDDNPVFGNLDYSGNDLIYAPKLTASVNFEYKVPSALGDFQLNGSYRYLAPYDQQISKGGLVLVGSTYVVQGNDRRTRTDKQNLVDASISFFPAVADGKMRVSVFGRNLLDDRGTDTAFTVAGLWSFATAREPRTYGVQLGYQF